ncbi:MAG: transcription antitermination protein NusB [Bacteroidales bacterium]
MISRRLIRVKVFKVLFSRISSGSESLQAAEKELLMSCDKTLDLYFYLLSLPVALRNVAENKIEAGLKKFHPTYEEANPNRRFVENRLIEKIANNETLIKKCEAAGLYWSDQLSFVKKLYNSVIEKEYFKNYMSLPSVTFADDVKLICDIFENELEESDDLYEIIEDISLYCSDDIAYVLNVIIERLQKVREDKKVTHPTVFIKDEDREYALRLLTQSLIHYDEYVELMSDFTLNWEPERIAATDLALIVMGIAEGIAFPNIPLKVSINEYVEIAKFYSTQNSKVFVNGVLDKVLNALQKDGKIQKSGRGLVGSTE